MDKVMDIRNFVAAAEGDAEHVLGKFLYFSLANLLVDKEELAELCDSMCIPYTSGNRLSVSDAFRSANVPALARRLYLFCPLASCYH